MTEYDYSPEAYEKYLQTQERISNWVSETKAQKTQYRNPFIPTGAARPTAYNQPKATSRSRSGGSRSSVNLTVKGSDNQRLRTLDPVSVATIANSGMASRDAPVQPNRSRSIPTIHGPPTSKPHPRSHHSHSRSRMHSQSQVNLPSYPQPQTYYYAPIPPPHSMPHSGPILVPMSHARQAQTYIVVPPTPIRARNPANSMPSRKQARLKQVAQKDPFLKRLFSWNSSSGSQRSSVASVETSSGRRPRRMSIY